MLNTKSTHPVLQTNSFPQRYSSLRSYSLAFSPPFSPPFWPALKLFISTLYRYLPLLFLISGHSHLLFHHIILIHFSKLEVGGIATNITGLAHPFLPIPPPASPFSPFPQAGYFLSSVDKWDIPLGNFLDPNSKRFFFSLPFLFLSFFAPPPLCLFCVINVIHS